LKREIPEGWEVKRLGEHLNFNENSISTNEKYNYIQYLDTSNLTENKICSIIKIEDPKQYPSRARRIIEENDILFSTVRPSQLHYGIIKNSHQYLIASTGFAVLSCKHGSQFNDIFYRFIIKDENIDTLNKIATLNASSYPSINPSDILNLNICMPTNLSDLIPLENVLTIYHKKLNITIIKQLI
jgi:type I restriction enzyme S subunit